MLDELRQGKIIAILRGVPRDAVAQVAEALVSGGIRFLEVTFGSDCTLDVIALLSEQLKGRAHVGAGTVLTPVSAKLALEAGAEFLLSPGMNNAREIIDLAHKHEKIAIPGAMTPTEIYQAIEWEADAVKVFPAASLGADFFKQVLAPLHSAKLVPTGGISLANVEEFFRVGAYAVGIGGKLADASAISRADYQAIESTARQYVGVVAGL